jgi:phosphonopyruvate decarboxylase
MGQITAGLFDLMRVPWEYFPTDERDVAGVLERAVTHMTKVRTPYGLIMKKDSVADHKLKTKAAPKPLIPFAVEAWKRGATLPTRREVLAGVQGASRVNDAIVATTGFTGRSLYAAGDRPNQLYMVGSMGCAGPFGLGLAWAQPSRRVIVLDGDGAVLMRMGALATLGYERPKNLLHVVIDNEVHDSTGGQSTVSHSVDLAAVAAACGYPRVIRAHTVAEIEGIVRSQPDELTFVHVKTAPGEANDLPRPKETPVEVIGRMRAWLRETAS